MKKAGTDNIDILIKTIDSQQETINSLSLTNYKLQEENERLQSALGFLKIPEMHSRALLFTILKLKSEKLQVIFNIREMWIFLRSFGFFAEKRDKWYLYRHDYRDLLSAPIEVNFTDLWDAVYREVLHQALHYCEGIYLNDIRNEFEFSNPFSRNYHYYELLSNDFNIGDVYPSPGTKTGQIDEKNQ